jgi:N-acetylglucosaminyl-diphospho-decaprenol L-rhamnosyltransferase
MISVVVVNWNAGTLLGGCIRSLREHAPDSEVVVVDNASADDSLREVAEWGAPVRLIRNTRNEGFAGGCNIGWRIATCASVLFLNPDAEATPGATAALERCLAEHGDAWAASGLLVSPDGLPQAGFNIRTFPNLASVAAEAFLLHRLWPSNPWTARHRMSTSDLRTPRDVEQPAAACLVVRRAALERLGGFDEGFHPAWWEDVDLCRRIHSAGGKIRFEPAARFIHHGASSLRRLSLEDYLVAFHTNEQRYFAKHHGADAAAKVWALRIAGLRLRSALAFVGLRMAGLSRRESARRFARAARRLAAGVRQ